MARIALKYRRWTAVALWLLGLLLAALLAVWNLGSSQREADNRLIGEAARTAGELSGLLALSEWGLDEQSARAAINGAMEDERIYAVKITLNHRTLEGQRRNYLWEPIPWDDEIAENSVQGMNPLVIDGQAVGRVEVWISARSVLEENSLLRWREFWRWLVFAFLWTLALALVMWQWGDAARLARRWKRGAAPAEGTGEILLGLAQRQKSEAPKIERPLPVCPSAARTYQHRHDEAWLVTAGLFRQTFARGPALISRLYSEGETASLAHLARILELAAPCLGAERLKKAAAAMREAINDPASQTMASSVEECAGALEEVLAALDKEARGEK